jgi:adenylate cyclase
MGFNIRHIRLHVGISIAFLLIFVPAIAAIIYMYSLETKQGADAISGAALDRSSYTAIAQVIDALTPVEAVTVEVAGFFQQVPDALGRAEMPRMLLPVIREHPRLYSLYLGFQADGTFDEALRIPEGAKFFGPNGDPVPPGAAFVLRVITRHAFPATETWTYVTPDGIALLTKNVTIVRYDPRERVFFRQAVANPDRAVLSDPYIFESTGRPGISASKLIRLGDGVVAVAGADLNLDGFSSILAAASPGANGVAMIIDASGDVIACPDVSLGIRRERKTFAMVRTADYENDAVQEATRNHAYSKVPLRGRFRLADGTEYLASFTPFPESLGKPWELLLVVPSGDFVGPLQQTTAMVMSFAALILITGLMAIRVLSTNIRHSIDLLIGETDRLRRLELDDATGTVSSRITEIIALADAIGAMKAALGSFVRFVPRTLVTELLATGRGLSLGGENREVTVMFTDLVNFSTIAEQVSARDLTLKVSEYFQAVSEEVIRHHGTIDKYVGDAVMALWNAPQTEEDHVAKACRAALQGAWRMTEVNRRWREEGWHQIGMRVGLHTDTVVAGIIGSTEHMSYTALGDGVNIAARLEGVNKTYGTTICVSHSVYVAVQDRFLMRPLDFAVVKGRTEPIRIYELMATLDEDPELGATPAQQHKATLTAKAFAAWAAHDYPAAEALYLELLDTFPDDRVASLFLRRCDQMLREHPAAQ